MASINTPMEAEIRLVAAGPHESRMQRIPWGTITGVVNVVAGVLLAVSSGIMTMTGQLPADISTKYGTILTVAGLTTAALAAGLLAVGRGLHNIGTGQQAIAVAQAVQQPVQENTVNVNPADTTGSPAEGTTPGA